MAGKSLGRRPTSYQVDSEPLSPEGVGRRESKSPSLESGVREEGAAPGVL